MASHRKLLFLIVAISTIFSTNLTYADLKTGIDALLSKNYQEALKNFEELDKENNSEAQYLLGGMHIFRMGVRFKNKELYKINALKYLMKAANQDHAAAQNLLGTLLKRSKQYKAAVKWYLKAANVGYAHAHYNMAIMYFSGKGVVVDPKLKLDPSSLAHAGRDINTGFKYLTKSAELGFAPAQYTLAYNYVTSYYHKRDIDKAIFWLEKSAQQNHAKSLFLLGKIYFGVEDVILRSTSVPIDKIRAKMYFDLTLIKDPQARGMDVFLTKIMLSKSEKIEVDSMVQNWLSKYVDGKSTQFLCFSASANREFLDSCGYKIEYIQ